MLNITTYNRTFLSSNSFASFTMFSLSRSQATREASRRLLAPPHRLPAATPSTVTASRQLRHSSSSASNTSTPSKKETEKKIAQSIQAKTTSAAHKKTMAELDEELRLKLEGISGDGGASGVEYEGGKAEGLKRNVKANMFRVI